MDEQYFNREILNTDRIIFEALRMSSLFIDFLKMQAKGGEWRIISDYVLGDNNKNNNVMTFIIYSVKGGEPIQRELDWLAEAMPRDLKDVSGCISNEAISILQNKNIFSISIIFDKKPFKNIKKEYAKKIIEWLVKYAESLTINYSDVVDAKTILRYVQKSKANSFNVRLFLYTLVLVSAVSALACHISAECNPKIIEWFSDRDAMVIHGDEVGFSLLHFVHFKLSCTLGYFPHFFVRIGIVCDDEAGNDGLWFDPLIRIPDYISGVVASVPLENGRIGQMKEKFKEGINAFCSDSQNIIFFVLKFTPMPEEKTILVTPYTLEITGVPRLRYLADRNLDG